MSAAGGANVGDCTMVDPLQMAATSLNESAKLHLSTKDAVMKAAEAAEKVLHYSSYYY